ncbi:MAG: DUF2809 domain-containing protein [Candidatus Marinimicrobia bacterium]|nr:DUF2809 domain-containing protein [Candidatus Neomarinimicrobiota bacterium]MCF7829950.1 DUF2809 domain-containing protein [Candidatus Neomarinimicrobiota bacterium]MCF7881896.1 DUF2809 domain-containing protein [Candidatus Neomarinimicrobiota bacterium]
MKFRVLVILSILVITPLGFATKFYYGPGEVWIQIYAGGVLYEIFWMLGLALVFPRLNDFANAGVVFGVTGLLEFAQLWHPPFLEALRSNFIGATIIGVGFDPWDFLYYAIGCLLGFLILRGYKSITLKSRPS